MIVVEARREGTIRVETLAWADAIKRRYGVDGLEWAEEDEREVAEKRGQRVQ
jgi:hypothetical protein